MEQLKQVSPKEFVINPFTAIGTDWMLISAKADDRINAMTASWGGLGVMWRRNVAFVVIRPTRFTKTLVDKAAGFSLSFLNHQKYEKALNYMGSVSGYQQDKIAGSGLTVAELHDIPYFAEADKVLICRKLFVSPYKPEQFIDHSVEAEAYPRHDYHDLYIAEIETFLQK